MFFSTSNAGGEAPIEGGPDAPLEDAKDLRTLKSCDVLLSCQGGEYTTEIYGPLRQSRWTGYWIDAASTLRMLDESALVLDPVDRHVIDSALKNGVKTFAGSRVRACGTSATVTHLLRWPIGSRHDADRTRYTDGELLRSLPDLT